MSLLSFEELTRDRKDRLMRFLGCLDRILKFSVHTVRGEKDRFTVELEMMELLSATEIAELFSYMISDSKAWNDALLHDLRPDLDNKDRERRMWEAYGRILPKFPWEPDEKAVVPEESENLEKIVGEYSADGESKIGEIPAKGGRFRSRIYDPTSIGVPLSPEDVFAIKAKADAEGDFVAAVIRRYLFAGLAAVSSQKVVLKPPCRRKKNSWLTVRIPYAKLAEINAARKKLRFRSRPQFFGALVHFALKQEAENEPSMEKKGGAR